MTYQFVCVKWGAKYPADYVNRLYGMIKRFCQADFALYCVTDDAADINPAVNILPLYDHSVRGWWQKLSLFRSELYGIEGDFLYIDLDVVVVDDLIPLFEYKPGSFLIGKDMQTGKYNSSVFRLTVGQQKQIWESFIQNPAEITAGYHGDQDWISETAVDASLWADEWIVSYKKQCNSRAEKSWGIVGRFLRKAGLMKIKGEATIPAGAIIIQFHGKPDPEDVMDGPYGIYKAAPWIKEYWFS
jgi:hypothetical protein